MSGGWHVLGTGAAPLSGQRDSTRHALAADPSRRIGQPRLDRFPLPGKILGLVSAVALEAVAEEPIAGNRDADSENCAADGQL